MFEVHTLEFGVQFFAERVVANLNLSADEVK
jgi:hypothetical protein